MNNQNRKTASWRDALPIHPAAELFPLMSPDELRVLGEDIKKNGLRSDIVLWRPSVYGGPTAGVQLLDGRNRLDAIETLVGEIEIVPPKASATYRKWKIEPKSGERRFFTMSEVRCDPYAYVVSANIHRRHLTAEQKRELIGKLLKATPEKSDRQIAEAVKASPTTVGTVRNKMEATGDVSKLDTRRDTKGREQPASKPKPKPAPEITPSATVAPPRAAEPAVSAGTRMLDRPKGLCKWITDLNDCACKIKAATKWVEQHLTEFCAEDIDPLLGITEDIENETFTLTEKLEEAKLSYEEEDNSLTGENDDNDVGEDDGLDIPASLRRVTQ
jgi:hypothetical protein